LKELKDEPDFSAPQGGEFSIGELRSEASGNVDFAGRREIHGAAHVEERGFAATTAAKQRGDASGGEIERDPAEGFYATFVGFSNGAD
jgi:hypothetical protein